MVESAKSSREQFKAHVSENSEKNRLAIEFGRPPGVNSFAQFKGTDVNWKAPSERDTSPFGKSSYVISPILPGDTKSGEFNTCFGIFITGRTKRGKSLTRVVHVYPDFVLANPETTKIFTDDLTNAVRKFKAIVKDGTIDATITTGWYPASTTTGSDGIRYGGDERRRRESARNDFLITAKLLGDTLILILGFAPMTLISRQAVERTVDVYHVAGKQNNAPRLYIDDPKSITGDIEGARYAMCRIDDVEKIINGDAA